MTKYESKVWDWVISHVIEMSIIFATLLSLAARYEMRGFVSRDMRDFLIPWFDQIQARGGMASLKVTVGNYNILYQSLIAIMTYIPIKPLYQYKILSIFFDYFQAIAIFCIIKTTTSNKTKAGLAYIIAIYLPTVMMNSSLWGQCDSIYTCFCLWSLLYLIKEHYNLSFIMLGIAFAFKLQAIFTLPFILFIYVKNKKFSALKLFWIPVMMIVLSMCGIMQGQPLFNVFSIYREQTTIGCMSVNYPSLWSIMVKNYGRNNIDNYTELHVYAITVTVILLLVIVNLLIKVKDIKHTEFIGIASLMVYTTVFFLPNMHERYGYLYVMLSTVYVWFNKKTLPAYIGLLILDMLTYGNYLFDIEPNWQVLSVVNFVIYCYYACCVMNPIMHNSATSSEEATI